MLIFITFFRKVMYLRTNSLMVNIKVFAISIFRFSTSFESWQYNKNLGISSKNF